MGNIVIKDYDEYFPHLHATLGKKDTTIFGGHILEGVVSITGEIIIIPWDKGEIERKIAPQSKSFQTFSIILPKFNSQI